VLALDPSKGKQDKSGDYSAFVMLGIDQRWNLWADADLDAGRPVEAAEGERSIVADGLRICAAWKPMGFVIETNGFQELVARAFLRAAEAKRLALPLYAVNNTEPKVARIRSLGVYLGQRRLRVRNTPGGRLLVAQLKDFPNGRFDDGPDSLKLAESMADYLLTGQNRQGGTVRVVVA
jgi:hypothetical protein